MPDGAGGGLRLDVQTFDHAINGLDKFWSFGAEAVDVDLAIGAGRGKIRASRIKVKVLCWFREISQVKDSIGIGDVDYLDNQFTNGRSESRQMDGFDRSTYSLATAAHCPSGDKAMSRIGRVLRVSILS